MPHQTKIGTNERSRPSSIVPKEMAQYGHFLEHLPVGAYTCNREGQITYFNSRAEEMWGRTPLLNDENERFCGSFKLYAVDGTLISRDESWMAQALRSGTGFNGREVIVERPDGSRITALAHANPFFDDAGVLLGAVNILIDISKPERVGDEMRHANIMLRTLVEASPLPIVVTDPDPMIVRLWNPAAEKLFGWKASDVLGKPSPFLIKTEEKSGEKADLQAVLRGQAFHDVETERRNKNGSLIRVSLSAAPLYEDGNVRGIVLIFTDMTARAKAENALMNANRTKDEFLATLAHELRNPLAPLRNAIEILQIQGVPKPESQWALDIMSRQMRQMTRLIDDLLDIARITGNKLELKKEVVELADALRIAIETSRPLIESSGHEFSVSFPEHPVHVRGDQVRIAQAVSNLLNNAAKYTEPGGRIWLSADRRGDQAIITVRDTGVGIAPDLLPHVFDMFRQGERASGPKGGLGIGLTLAKRLIKMHGGTIRVESKGSGKGSSFTVQLPIVKMAGDLHENAEKEIETPKPSMRLLIVDDNEDAVATLQMMLSFSGYQMRVAHDGVEAVDVANTYRPNVILLDIGMPRMNGYEAAATIRKQWWGEDMTLIAMTGWGQESDRQKSKEAGFDEHLVKPVDPRTLLKLLKRIEEKKTVTIS